MSFGFLSFSGIFGKRCGSVYHRLSTFISNLFVVKKYSTDSLMTEGRDLLAFAAGEMNRANEDVVAYVVCHNTRKAITNFLNSFLVANGERASNEDIDELMQRCAKHDGRFSNIDMTPLACSGYNVEGNDCYCLDPEKLNTCVQLAQRVEKMVSYRAPAY
jgi:hypothetical protein